MQHAGLLFENLLAYIGTLTREVVTEVDNVRLRPCIQMFVKVWVVLHLACLEEYTIALSYCDDVASFYVEPSSKSVSVELDDKGGNKLNIGEDRGAENKIRPCKAFLKLLNSRRLIVL
jgi:hypothetical protein